MSQASVLFDVPGPKAKARYRLYGLVGGLLIALALGLIVWGMRAQLGLDKWTPFLNPVAWTAYLLPGLGATLTAAAISVVLASLLGLVLGMGRLSHIRVVNWLSSAFVEFFRSVPVLMMMIAAYYVFLYNQIVPPDYLSLAGVVTGLTLYNSCVIAELIRSGVNSLPHGQREAGLAIGLTRTQTLSLILVPQAITAMMPSLVSQLVVILKDTALGYFITYSELLREGMNLAAWQTNLFATLIVVGAIYLVLNELLGRAAVILRQRLSTRISRTPEQVEGDLATEADPDARLYADPLAFDEAKDESYEGHRRHYYAPEELAEEERKAQKHQH